MNTQYGSIPGVFSPLSDKQIARMSGTAMSRREAIQRTLLGAAGLVLGHHLSLRALAAARSAKAKAKSVIQIWMWGVPSHLDTWDPKPEAGNDYCGPLNKPIATNLDGVRICELMPLLAKQADKYAIIRSMTHGNNGHETASYMVQTAREQGGRDVFPSVGAVVCLFKGAQAGYRGLLPPYIVLTEPQGRFSEAGFLGARYKPFATGGDPGQSRFAVEGVVTPGISDQRQRDRRELLHKLNTLEHTMPGDAQLTASEQCEKQAYDLILGDAGKVFDLSQEKDALRERTSPSPFPGRPLAIRGGSNVLVHKWVSSATPFPMDTSQTIQPLTVAFLGFAHGLFYD